MRYDRAKPVGRSASLLVNHRTNPQIGLPCSATSVCGGQVCMHSRYCHGRQRILRRCDDMAAGKNRTLLRLFLLRPVQASVQRPLVHQVLAPRCRAGLWPDTVPAVEAAVGFPCLLLYPLSIERGSVFIASKVHTDPPQAMVPFPAPRPNEYRSTEGTEQCPSSARIMGMFGAGYRVSPPERCGAPAITELVVLEPGWILICSRF